MLTDVFWQMFTCCPGCKFAQHAPLLIVKKIHWIKSILHSYVFHCNTVKLRITLIYFETRYATTKAENMSVLSDISQCPKISISQYPKIYGGCSLREVDRMEILRHQQMSSLLMCAEGVKGVQPLTMLRFTFDHLHLQPIMGLGSNIRLDSGCPCVLEILRRLKYHRCWCLQKV